MKTAVVDLGTNTFNLLIGEMVDGRIKTIHKDKIPVKLGEGGINDNLIAPAPYQRAIKAMLTHKETILNNEVDKVIALGTSALRTSTNGSELLKDIYEQTAIDVELIDGNREAELIYHGVKQAVDLGEKKNLLMDIGGGSTEFIICNEDQILWKQSYPLGVSRLKEKFTPSDPITIQDIGALEDHFASKLNGLFHQVEELSINTLIGSSGSFSSYAAMVANKSQIQKDSKRNYQFSLNDIADMHQSLVASTSDDRLKMNGLAPMRVDTIVIASVFINYLIDKLNLKEIHWSKYALKEGAMWEAAQKEKLV